MHAQLLRRSLYSIVLFATALPSVLINSTGLAATSNSTGAVATGCTCNGKPIPARLCPLIHCPDAAVPSNDTNKIQAQDNSQTPLLIARDWFGWERPSREPKPRTR